MNDSKPLNIAITSLGCPKNLVDSEKMMAILAEGGCVIGAPMDDADVIVINTCGFLGSAREESLEVIEEALACKAGGGVKRVVVAGCLVNRDAEKLFEVAPEIDAIVGVDNRQQILEAVLGTDRVTCNDGQAGELHSDSGRFRLTVPHSGYLRISEGCSRRCSFCTIPAIRGPFRSKPAELVLSEARELVADGAIELNVIGQDTTGYGRDLKDGSSLASLLRELDELDGLAWIRLLYAYPGPFDDELIETIANGRRIVPYLDMPLQHIAEPILKRMGRGISRQAIETLLGKLRERVDGLTIRTTFISGFPGETEADFAELLNFVKEFKFDALGVFEFSPEEGTPAFSMAEQVPDEVKADRAEQIMLAQQQIAFDANEQLIDTKLDVLIDGIDADGLCLGRHKGQAPEVDSVCLVTDPRPAGEIFRAKVVGFEDYDLLVEPE